MTAKRSAPTPTHYAIYHGQTGLEHAYQFHIGRPRNLAEYTGSSPETARLQRFKNPRFVRVNMDRLPQWLEASCCQYPNQSRTLDPTGYFGVIIYPVERLTQVKLDEMSGSYNIHASCEPKPKSALVTTAFYYPKGIMPDSLKEKWRAGLKDMGTFFELQAGLDLLEKGHADHVTTTEEPLDAREGQLKKIGLEPKTIYHLRHFTDAQARYLMHEHP